MELKSPSQHSNSITQMPTSVLRGHARQRDDTVDRHCQEGVQGSNRPVIPHLFVFLFYVARSRGRWNLIEMAKAGCRLVRVHDERKQVVDFLNTICCCYRQGTAKASCRLVKVHDERKQGIDFENTISHRALLFEKLMQKQVLD